jgi:hypothetical protein
MSKRDDDLRLDAVQRFLAPVFFADVLSPIAAWRLKPRITVSKQPLDPDVC